MSDASAVGPERDQIDATAHHHEVRRTVGHPSFIWCFMGFLVANMFSRHTDSLPLPVGPDRLLFATAATLLLLDPRYRLRDLRFKAVHGVAAAVVGWAALSAFAAGTLTGGYGFFALLDRLTIPYLLFAVAPLAFRRAEDRLLLLQTLACMGLYLGTTAFFEILGPQSLVFPRYIVDPTVGIQYGRARGPFTASEANGLTMLVSLFASLVLSRVSPSLGWRRVSRLAAGVSAVGCLLTLTRSIWVGLVLGTLLVAITDPRLRRIVGGGIVVTALLSAALVTSSSALAEKVDGRANDAKSVDARRNTNAAAVRAIRDHPIVGIGWVRFVAENSRYVRQSDTYPLTVTDIEVHNVVLSRTAELGLIGGGLWLASVVLGPGLALIRRPRSPRTQAWRTVLIGASAGWAISIMASPLSYPLPNNLIWLLAGLVTAETMLIRSADDATDIATAY